MLITGQSRPSHQVVKYCPISRSLNYLTYVVGLSYFSDHYVGRKTLSAYNRVSGATVDEVCI